jgi:alcohol dehydrogenase
MIAPFPISRLPRIQFGSGVTARVPEIARSFGRRALLVTGARSFRESDHWLRLQSALRVQGIEWLDMEVAGEPSPQLVDDAVRRFHGAGIDVVIGIGGGSALDAAKAIAGLLRPGNSVMDHLEGVGPELPYQGPAVPLIAVPTTAGTGSEATKNAVLSVQGEGGFKKSFRDEKLVAEYAVVDPDLLASCPRDVIAANGMDAFTQLLESCVSLRANPFTDALALSGLEAVRDGLLPWYDGYYDTAAARAKVAYAALLSGITLAQVGLGSVHGLAAPLGAFFPIPHGVACGTLVAAATRINIHALELRAPDSPALAKYANIGRLLASEPDLHDEEAREALVLLLDSCTERLMLPGLRAYGIRESDVARIVSGSRGSSMKTNPVVLEDAEIAEVVTARL